MRNSGSNVNGNAVQAEQHRVYNGQRLYISCRTLKGETFTISIGSNDTIEQLLVIVSKKTGLESNNFNLIHCGLPINSQSSQKLLSQLGIKDKSRMIVVQRLAGSVGQFATHEGTTGRQLLTAPFAQPDPQTLSSIVREHKGDPNAAFSLHALPAALGHCRTLIAYADRQHQQLASQSGDDLKLSLSREQLVGLTDPSLVVELESLMQNGYSQILLRRCQSHGLHIRFHTDVSLRTLQLSLNDDSEYVGGRLVFLSGGQAQVPARAAGTVTVHGADLVHGVTRLDSGVRYGLFLLKDRPQTVEGVSEVEEVKEAEVASE